MTESYEGPEKLLEIWFAAVDGASLRDIKRPEWIKLLLLIKCEILSVIENEHVTAYLLSESSMFVYEHKIIIKTCGTTTLLKCTDLLIQMAAQQGLATVDYCFYSRKNFTFRTVTRN